VSAKNVFSKRDSNSLGFRYSKLTKSDVFSTYITSRYRFENGLSLSAKLRYDDRSNTNGTSQQIISPTLRVQFQNKKHYIYADVGSIHYDNETLLTVAQKSDVYYLYFGYRYYF